MPIKTAYNAKLRINLIFLSFTTASTFGCVSEQNAHSENTVGMRSDRACPLSSNSHWNHKNPPRLFLLSLDGLNLEALKEYAPKLKNPHPSGLNKILKEKNQHSHLTVKNPTITASSHTSTITCSTAGVHGIFANTQWNGQRNVSGFAAPTGTETFPSALRAAGLKVVTAGYPSLDNSEIGRTVSEGFTYGETLGSAAVVSMDKKQSHEHIWKNQKNEIVARLIIKKTGDRQYLFECSGVACDITAKPNGSLQNISLMVGNRRAVAYAIDLKSKQEEIYVSALGMNTAFPEAISTQLDQCGIVFSPGKDLSLARFGADAIISGLEHRLNFFQRAWSLYLPSTGADAVFAYLEDIDALRHQFSGEVDASENVLRHVEKVDRIVGDLIHSLPKETNVVIMGDHGMSTVRKELNVRAIIPESALKQSIVFTSGGTLLMYPKSVAHQKVDSQAIEPSAQWLTHTRETLRKFTLQNKDRPIFEKVLIKGTEEMRSQGLDHPSGPWLIAFANETIGLQNSLSEQVILADTDDSQLPLPRPRGQHGHNAENSSMETFLSMWGPDLDLLPARELKFNTDIIPAIAKALNWPTPRQCAGRSK